jgi:hypothetical protein
MLPIPSLPLYVVNIFHLSCRKVLRPLGFGFVARSTRVTDVLLGRAELPIIPSILKQIGNMFILGYNFLMYSHVRL